MTQDVVPGRGELLLGTRAELEADIARLVHEAGAARGVLRFTDPQPWPGMPGKFYIRVGVVREMQRPAPVPRRLSWAAAGVLGLIFTVALTTLGILAVRVYAAAGGVVGLLAAGAVLYLVVSLATRRRRPVSVTVTTTTTTIRTR